MSSSYEVTELTILTKCMSQNSEFFTNFAPVSWFQSISWSFIWIYIAQKVFLELNNMIYMHNFISLLWKIIKNWKSKFRLVFGQFSIPSWSEKGHEPSRVELKNLQLELCLCKISILFAFESRVFFASECNLGFIP